MTEEIRKAYMLNLAILNIIVRIRFNFELSYVELVCLTELKLTGISMYFRINLHRYRNVEMSKDMYFVFRLRVYDANKKKD
jgi:hypothetical protein